MLGVGALRYPGLLSGPVPIVSRTLSPAPTGPLPLLGLSPYRWTSQGAGLVVVGDGVEYQACTTSTSTVVVQPEGPLLFDTRGTYLRMYGLNTGVPAVDAGGAACVLQASANVRVAGLPVPWVDPTTGAEAPNIAYWDSNTVSGDGSLASAADYQFRTTVALVAAGGPKQAPGVLTATAIAGVVGPRTLEGVDLFSAYKDVHVLKLADQYGEQGGWLMVAGRYTAESELGVGYPLGIAPESTLSAIVGFWSTDPGFATDVRGPYFLVSRMHDLPFVPDGPTELWLGVPSSVVLEVDGEAWLYVYYTAEDSNYDKRDDERNALLAYPDWRPGTYVRRIRIADLPWGSLLGHVRVGNSSGGGTWVTPAVAADETGWNSTTGEMLVVGESLGKVQIWAARDPYSNTDSRWRTGEDPAARGNVLIWDLRQYVKDVDGDVELYDDGLSLYVALNSWTDDPTPAPYETNQIVWGIWRTTAGPAAMGRIEGTDFVLRWIPETDPGGEYDCVARSNPSDNVGVPWDDQSQMRLDPDPVRLPSGDWIVFTGSDTPRVVVDKPLWPLARFDTGETNGDRRFGAAWRR